MIRLITVLSIIIIAFSISSCDAPRLNPLDPQSKDYKLGQLDGYVFSYPHDALQGARILLTNQNISVESDSKGYYKIEGVKTLDGEIVIEKEGFTNDTIAVRWNNQKNIRMEESVLDYSIGQIDGTVRAAAPSLKALGGAKVFWKNQNVLLTTDSQGYFKLTNVPFGNGWLYFEADGYSRDSMFVEFDNQREMIKHLNNIYLNSIPKLHDFKIYTSVENWYPDKRRYRMEVQVSISDDELDIDSVFLKCSDLNFSKAIRYNSSSRYYEGSYIQSDLNLTSMEEAIGKTFYIVVKDANNKSFTIGSSNIKRIINDIIDLDSPVNSITVNSLPTLKWIRLRPGFKLHYWVQVYTNDVSPILMWDKDNVTEEEFQATVDSPLSTGDYFWVVWCVDDFGNKARSRPATFSVN
jgi:hypothetical protein